MTKRWILIAAALAVPSVSAVAQPAAPPASAGLARDPVPTTPTGFLTGLVRADDYPQEALDKGEQGTVIMKLRVGTDGRAKGCEVTSSSGSALLDAKTCEIMLERARFTPATNAKGKPVEGEFSQRITWRISSTTIPAGVNAPDSRFNNAINLWSDCMMGEAAKLTRGKLPASDVADRSVAACATFEPFVESEMNLAAVPGMMPSVAIRSLKEVVRKEIVRRVTARREKFGLQ